jgi:hypothetical protein
MRLTKISDLENKYIPSLGDLVIIADADNSNKAKSITVANLLGLAQNTPCKYCGSRGKFDVRGNCGACGAPITK